MVTMVTYDGAYDGYLRWHLRWLRPPVDVYTDYFPY